MPVFQKAPSGATWPVDATPDGAWRSFWIGASGTNNPLTFTVTNANATVTAVFAALPTGQGAMTVLADGSGSVTRSPGTNRFGPGVAVTLTTVPESGQSFLGWSGDTNGAQNPLVLTTGTGSKWIAANFTRRPRLAVFTCGGALDPANVPLLLSGEFGEVYVIEPSADLQQWNDMATVTNVFGTVQWNDTTGGEQRFYRARPGP